MAHAPAPIGTIITLTKQGETKWHCRIAPIADLPEIVSRAVTVHDALTNAIDALHRVLSPVTPTDRQLPLTDPA